MLFKKIILHNFGIYKGRHEIDLAPPSEDRPIVLFGGLNGGGKTTFLHAVQVALYGKFASCVVQSTKGYESVLSEFINKDTRATEGAAVELHLEHFVDGSSERIDIFRAWKKSGKSVSENFEVKRDGLEDPVMADRWYELVEGLLPSSLSNLFFFDGEKIQSLADPASSAEFVRRGIHDLLGLDLVSTLISDLKINERRKLIKEVGNKELSDELKKAEDALAQLSRQQESFVFERGETNKKLDDLDREEEKIKAKYRAMGGELLDQRESILKERDRLMIELHHVDQQLRDLAAGAAPLLLVRDLLSEVRQQAQRENEVVQEKAVLNSIKERDRDLLALVDELSVGKDGKERIANYLKSDHERRAILASQPIVLHTSPEELAPFSDQTLDDLRARLNQLLNHRESVEARVADQNRMLEGMPDPEGLEGMTVRLSTLEAQRLRLEVEKNALEERMDRHQSMVVAAERRLEQIQLINAEQSFSSERLGRVVKSSQKAREMLGAFQKRLSANQISKLQHLILDSFKILLRKSSLVESIEIQPETFELLLRDSAKRRVPPERLSAGERQLLSVAILWGLAKASGRPIPTIIDTPLGRLDGSHRRKLVENYFPNAAHQVILLSTDEEISGDLYASLSESIGHEYMLTFNEDLATTEISEGYEFRGAA